MRISRENYRLFLKPFIGINTKATMNERYKLSQNFTTYFISQWVPIGISKESGFWQQISPSYYRKGNALRYAKRNNITLENN